MHQPATTCCCLNSSTEPQARAFEQECVALSTKVPASEVTFYHQHRRRCCQHRHSLSRYVVVCVIFLSSFSSSLVCTGRRMRLTIQHMACAAARWGAVYVNPVTLQAQVTSSHATNVSQARILDRRFGNRWMRGMHNSIQTWRSLFTSRHRHHPSYDTGHIFWCFSHTM